MVQPMGDDLEEADADWPRFPCVKNIPGNFAKNIPGNFAKNIPGNFAKNIPGNFGKYPSSKSINKFSPTLLINSIL